MKRRTTTMATAGLLALVGQGSAQALLWDETHGGSWPDGAQAVQETAEGGLIVAGSTASSSATHLEDGWLLKADGLGRLEWTLEFGGDFRDYAATVRQTNDGGYVVAGRTGVAAQEYDAFLLRAGPDGQILWERAYDAGDDDRAHAVVQTADGGFAFAGQAWFGDDIFGSYDFRIVKTDADGNELWSRTYGGPDGFQAEDVGRALIELPDGGFAVAGHTSSLGAGSWDVYVVRTDSQGTELCSRPLGGEADDRGLGIARAADGGLVVAGWTGSQGAGWLDLYLAKLTDGRWPDCNGNGQADGDPVTLRSSSRPSTGSTASLAPAWPARRRLAWVPASA